MRIEIFQYEKSSNYREDLSLCRVINRHTFASDFNVIKTI